MREHIEDVLVGDLHVVPVLRHVLVAEYRARDREVSDPYVSGDPGIFLDEQRSECAGRERVPAGLAVRGDFIDDSDDGAMIGVRCVVRQLIAHV